MSDSADPVKTGYGKFVSQVLARLEQGRVDYGDRSFALPPTELINEMQQEALDIAGWGFILWTRLENMRSAMAEPREGVTRARADIVEEANRLYALAHDPCREVECSSCGYSPCACDQQ